MELKERVFSLLQGILREHETLFLIDLSVTPDHRIKVVIDGDSGVNLKECVLVSRTIEQSLLADDIDFALEVTSAGATAPLVLARQYAKHIGRKLEVRTLEGAFEGTLTQCDADQITVEWKSREPKPVGKGKVTVQHKRDFLLNDIEEAKVKLTF
ncbi:MAG: ribosome assembly cofactor RimP [Flavobacteriaceae bacterium]|nr:ribosome assembly cofactor RimP [Flavobacteriaceae bacterium]MDH3796622.1 ribosome assembly cofactor RimP [Flavobacteriaceae bacterium]